MTDGKPRRSNEKKICFVISPMGEEDSSTRIQSERLLRSVIEPATKKLGYTLVAPAKLAGSVLITSEIIGYLVTAPLVIADLTGGNANVFYELALRHAVRKPCIQIIAKSEKIKFDVGGVRTIRFDITSVASEDEAKTELIKYIREAEKNTSPETPISAAGLSTWLPFTEIEKGLIAKEMSAAEKRRMEAMLQEYLENLASAEATPPEVKLLIEELMASHRVNLLEDTGDDLDAACALVEHVQEGGYISATSSLQHRDADERITYRATLNDALKRNVTYRKIICSSSELTVGRYETWKKEFEEKATLIRSGSIDPTVFQLLHYPSPMSVDVLISQDANGACLEMVAGFAGGEGHGGFHTDDKRMVEEWLNIYLEAKIVPVAERHTKAVLARTEECPCLEFLGLLEKAREDDKANKAASQPAPPTEPQPGQRNNRRIRR
jgi:hypothetical protein